MAQIQLVSSDLNGTLVHQNTMSDMIRLYRSEEAFRQADSVFKNQTNGSATMEEAFARAGPLTRGLTLRQAIEYTTTHMRYVKGFHEFIDTLHNNGLPIVINSTGYSITIYALREQLGENRIHGQIGNLLKFGADGDPKSTLREDELEQLVAQYFSNPEIPNDKSYDNIKATGVVELGIKDEDAKAKLILRYAKEHFSTIKPNHIAHIGDTMGDSGGIHGIAREGGLGIAFNYNEALERFLREKLASEQIPGRIVFVDSKSESTNLIKILQHLKG